MESLWKQIEYHHYPSLLPFLRAATESDQNTFEKTNGIIGSSLTLPEKD